MVAALSAGLFEKSRPGNAVRIYDDNCSISISDRFNNHSDYCNIIYLYVYDSYCIMPEKTSQMRPTAVVDCAARILILYRNNVIYI